MTIKIKEILSKFVASEYCSEEELTQLKNWLTRSENKKELEDLLESEWNKNDQKETFIEFTDIQKKIGQLKSKKERSNKFQFNNILENYQKWAAVLLFPVLLFSGYKLFVQDNRKPVYFETIAERGQKSQIVLPDGSKVWLNSETQLKYTSDFGNKNRFTELSGEAFFEVTKNQKKPFIVSTGDTQVKVKGTSFNVKAYADEDEIETLLVEGKIELTMFSDPSKKKQKTIEMFPGQSVTFSKVNKTLEQNNSEIDESIGWKNNQLIFRDDSFNNLVKKIERWYDVEIIYDETSLKDQRLTVELYQGERLDRLIEIIELAISVECKVDGNKIYVKMKKKE